MSINFIYHTKAVSQARTILWKYFIIHCECDRQANTQIHPSSTAFPLMGPGGQWKVHPLVRCSTVLDTFKSNNDSNFLHNSLLERWFTVSHSGQYSTKGVKGASRISIFWHSKKRLFFLTLQNVKHIEKKITSIGEKALDFQIGSLFLSNFYFLKMWFDECGPVVHLSNQVWSILNKAREIAQTGLE